MSDDVWGEIAPRKFTIALQPLPIQGSLTYRAFLTHSFRLSLVNEKIFHGSFKIFPGDRGMLKSSQPALSHCVQFESIAVSQDALILSYLVSTYDCMHLVNLLLTVYHKGCFRR